MLVILHVHEKFNRVLNQLDEGVRVAVVKLPFLLQEGLLIVIINILVTPDLHAQVKLKNAQSHSIVFIQ